MGRQGEEKQLIPTILDLLKLKIEHPLFKLATKFNSTSAMEHVPSKELATLLNSLTKT